MIVAPLVAVAFATLAAQAEPAAPPPPSAEPAPAATVAQAEPAAPAPAPPSDDLSARLDEVDERARIAERKLELLEEASVKAKTESPVVVAGDKGFQLKSADGAFLLKLRGLVHADGRQYVDDEDLRFRDTFVMRRVRPLIEATFGDLVDFRLMPDFGNGTATVQDAYADVRPFTWLKLRAGKFKPPVGLERLQSASAIHFVERALPTSLVPNRDVGAQLHGALFGGGINYELGLFNGVTDGGSGDADNNHDKDFAGRLFLQPWKSDPYSALAGLGVGIAGSIGDQRGTPATFTTSGTTVRRTATSTPSLPAFRTAGQMTFFSYLTNDDVPDSTVYARGRRTRISPQGYYFVGSFGVLAEYVRSQQRVRKGAAAEDLAHEGWQVAALYVLGGKALFEGSQATEAFNPAKGTWGALEIAARINALEIDDDTFPTFADPARSAKRALAYGGSLNWLWSRNLKLATSFEHTEFDGGAAANGDRRPEIVVFQRVQAAF